MSVLNRISTLILTAGILISSIGIPVNRHYCMSRLKDVKLFAPAGTCLNESGMDIPLCPLVPNPEKQNKGCCKNTHEIVKIDNAQNQIVKVELSKLPPVYVPVYFYSVTLDVQDTQPLLVNNYHKPPPIFGSSKRVEFHSLLI